MAAKVKSAINSGNAVEAARIKAAMNAQAAQNAANKNAMAAKVKSAINSGNAVEAARIKAAMNAQAAQNAANKNAMAARLKAAQEAAAEAERRRLQAIRAQQNLNRIEAEEAAEEAALRNNTSSVETGVRNNANALVNMGNAERAAYNDLSNSQKADYRSLKPTIGLNNSMKSWEDAMNIANPKWRKPKPSLNNIRRRSAQADVSPLLNRLSRPNRAFKKHVNTTRTARGLSKRSTRRRRS